jgi:hypothetical protein
LDVHVTFCLSSCLLEGMWNAFHLLFIINNAAMNMDIQIPI